MLMLIGADDCSENIESLCFVSTRFWRLIEIRFNLSKCPLVICFIVNSPNISHHTASGFI